MRGRRDSVMPAARPWKIREHRCPANDVQKVAPSVAAMRTIVARRNVGRRPMASESLLSAGCLTWDPREEHKVAQTNEETGPGDKLEDLGGWGATRNVELHEGRDDGTDAVDERQTHDSCESSAIASTRDSQYQQIATIARTFRVVDQLSGSRGEVLMSAWLHMVY
jgi:hypothetical protein